MQRKKKIIMQFDIIIIGSGPGGYVAAIRASQLGKKVAVVEKESLGGVCLNWGCIPTKALLKSAQVFNYINHAEEYGIKIGSPDADFPKMISRSRSVADGMSKGVNFLMKKNKITILIIGYREAMTLPVQPKKLVVVGAGAIGVEFAYFYHSIGTEVTVVEFMEQGLLPREDVDISRELGKIYKKAGMNILANSAVENVDISGPQCKVTIKNRKDNTTQVIECDVVLSAAGVSPNTEDIGLEALGIETDRGMIKVDGYCQTNVPGIYAIGDVIPTQALAHVASAEGIVCVEKIAGHHPEPLDYSNIPSCTYCWPEVSSVGMTEAQAKEAGYELKIGKFPFSASGKASASGAKDGFVKVIYDAKYGELLGAHMIGANVTEMIAELVLAKKLESTGMEILKAVHPPPTMSEAVMEATAAAYDEVIHL
ncbi:MAG: dihydrolipoyl dehydrogenase [Saprospiraceae bacterium]|nr:dihydrolipoyl dehydrogenase [Saprospiraceae bacterium]